MGLINDKDADINKELVFQNEKKEKQVAELIIANNELKKQKTDNKKTKRKYVCPDITVTKIDNEVSLIMMSVGDRENDPAGHKKSNPDKKLDKPFNNPFH